jgi:HlyD family secretion protein
MDDMNSTTAVAEPPKPAPEGQKLKRRKKKKTLKVIIIIAVIVVVLAGIAFGMYKLFHKEETEKKILTDVVQRGPIQSMVTGSGVTKAKDSATITLTSGGTVLEVFVKDGDTVNEGDQLYSIDSTEAMASVDTAQKTVNNYQKQLKALNDSYQYLTVSADFAGTLLSTATIKAGDAVATGTKIATLVDDSKMRLVLYFSYAYEDAIKKGQTVVVSVPSTMNQIEGTVAEIDYVKKVTPEGSKLFQVVITVNNPGALTADMGATATLTGNDGELIYPYEAGKLAWNRTKDIVTKAAGDASYINLLDYAQVGAGEALLKLDAADNDDEVAAIENQLKTAEEALKKAQDNLKNFNAVAPLSGTVLSCALVPGERVESGKVAISIANTSVMTVEAQIDELNVSYVKTGMPVQITQWSKNGQEPFNGIVESVSLEGKFENGVSFFPAIVTVDNPDGRLLSGMYVDYNLIAAQEDSTLLVPVQAVKYTEGGTCLFIKAETKPDNALDAASMGLDVPEGFYAVPVTVGLSDTTNAEILDGVAEGTEVFTQYMTDQGSSDMGGPMGGVMIG